MGNKCPDILDVHSYKRQHRINLAVSIPAILLAGFSLWHFLTFRGGRAEFLKDWFGVVSVFFWTLAPPAWFFIEFFVLWEGATDAELKRVQDGQKLAQAFWAAVLAALLFLVPKS